MTYFYSNKAEFEKESCVEYKSKKSAIERFNKEGVGAVFDEEGKMIVMSKNVQNLVEQPKEELQEQTQEQPKEGPQELAQEQPKEESQEQIQEEFDVQTICDVLIIRAGAGKDFKKIGYIMEDSSNKKNHTIVEVVDGWGRIKDETGWISLALTKRV